MPQADRGGACRYPDAVTERPASAPTAIPDVCLESSTPHSAYPGLFLSVEGGDGVGKSTQITLLMERLRAAGVACVSTREPGGTALGAQIRQLLLHGDDMAPRAEALLYAADRAHHIATLVRPALAQGCVVVTDRYLDSSVAYQGAARALGSQEVRNLSLWATGGLLPDLTILLDADPSLGSARAGQRAVLDRLEREGESFHMALRREFLGLAQAEPERFVVIDAARSVEAVAADIDAAVVDVLRRRGSQIRMENGVHATAADAYTQARNDA